MQKVIDGVLTNYEVVGKGKKNLLILHGWKGQIAHWMPTATELKNRYKVILLDLPGFGGSTKPNENWGVYEYAGFTAKFIQSIGIKKASVLGHSFGGRIAILLASRYPELIERLILVDAAGMEIKSTREKIIKFLSIFKMMFPESIKKKLRSPDYVSAGEMRKIFLKVIRQPLRDELKNISCQTIIVWGEKDKILSLWEAEMLHEGIKKSILRIVWGATHWPHVEKFVDFLNILQEEGV